MPITKRLLVPLIILSTALFLGTLGYKYLGGEGWSWVDAFYMTAITLTTVGYGETHPFTDTSLRLFTVLLIFSGWGVVTYTLGTITALLVDGNIRNNFRRNKMIKKIKKMKGHIIICGATKIGLHIIKELLKNGKEFVVIDLDESRIEKVIGSLGNFLYVVGDATDDETLYAAGIESATGIITALTNDKDNLFITISVRAINPKIRIVAKAIDIKSRPKLIRAGANVVTTPHLIGGLRMASEMIRPSVTIFLDHMIRDENAVVRIDEVVVPEHSKLCGKTVWEADLRRKTGMTLLAIRRGYHYNYELKHEDKIQPKDILIVFGNIKQLGKLRKIYDT